MVNSFPPLIFCERIAATTIETSSPTMCATVISSPTSRERQNAASANALPKFAKLFQRMVEIFMPSISQNIVASAMPTGTTEKSKKPISGREANTVP